MRLTCPNCAAQYEVESDVIPAGGRDVQCSNCGHTWFQRQITRPLTQPVSEPVTDPFAGGNVPGETPQASEPRPELESEPVAAQAKPMREDVSSILREEAKREMTEREIERESAGLEMQPELGGIDNDMDEMPANIAESEAVLDEPDHSEAEAAAAAIAARGSKRKDLLPDIEEINSTLSPEETEEVGQEAEIVHTRERRSGFRQGFTFVVAIFAIMVAVYLFAPNIVELNPQSASAMGAYVDWVNNLRTNLDGTMANWATRITALVDSIGS